MLHVHHALTNKTVLSSAKQQHEITTFTVLMTTLGTLRFATARCCYGYEKSNLLPVTSAHALQYGFPAVAYFSTTAKCFGWRSPHYVSINFHFHAIFMIISLFSEVKFKD